MNQILSLEAPKKTKKKRSRVSGEKINIKSIITFFCVVLIALGVALIGIATYSMLTNNKKTTANNIQSDLPRIDVTQNATELEIEISSENEIDTIQYNWEDQDIVELKGEGKKTTTIKVDIPSGNNIFKISVTDVDGKRNEYSKEYVGAKEPNITGIEQASGKNIITITCEEEQNIKSISYNYDDGEDKTKEINNTKAVIEVEALEGKHELTIKVQYEDGTIGKKSKNVYFPKIEIQTDGANGNYSKFIITASDQKEIDRAVINFNGVESVEQVDSTMYSKVVQLKPGEPGSNKLIITIYNKDGMSITKRVWDKNRKN